MNVMKITKVVVDGFKLSCVFGTGEVVEFDMADIQQEAGPMAQPLKDPVYFAKVFLELGTPTWPNGYDVCPDLIHQTGKLVNHVA